MDEMIKCKASIIFTLDCGTSSFNIIDNEKFKNIRCHCYRSSFK